MNLFSDLDGYLYYNEFLFHLMKFNKLEAINANLSEEGFNIIQKEETKNLQFITSRRKNELRQGKNQSMKQCINPVVQYLFINMSFKALKGNMMRSQKISNFKQKRKETLKHDNTFTTISSIG